MSTRRTKRPRGSTKYEQTAVKPKRAKKGNGGHSNQGPRETMKRKRKGVAGQKRKKSLSGVIVEVQYIEEVYIATEEDPQMQDVILQNTAKKVPAKRPANKPQGNSDNKDDSEEWLSFYIEKSKKEAESVKPSTVETVDTFQEYFLNNLSLKPELVTTIVSVEGVQEVGWGFSHTDKGQQPVIQINPTSSVNAAVIEEIISEIQSYIKRTYKKDCKVQEIQQYIEISKSEESSKSVEILQSKPGEKVETTYHSDTPRSILGRLIGFVYAQLEVTVDNWRHRYGAHFPVLPFHCILPTECSLFRERIPEVLENRQGKLHIAEYPGNICQSVPEVCGGDPLSYQTPTLMKATVFPDITCASMGHMEREGMRTITQSGDRLQGFLAGKAGMIGKKDDRYIPVIINSLEYSNPPVPFSTHPCNVDVAVCKIHNTKHCSFVDALNSPNMVQIPSRRTDLEGEIAMLKDGEFITVARNGLSKVECCTADGTMSFPFYKWKNDDSIAQSPGRYTILSGSPVFVIQEESSFFLGGSFTPETAFDSKFALEIIRPEICEYLVSDVIETLNERMKKERKAAMRNRLQQVVRHLKKFHERIVRLKCNQVTAWREEITLDELHGTPQEQNGTIKCKVEYCVNRHKTTSN